MYVLKSYCHTPNKVKTTVNLKKKNHCISQGSLEKQKQQDGVCVCVCYKEWLTWLWRTTKPKQQCELAIWRPGRVNGTGEIWRQFAEEFPFVQGGWSFCSIQNFNCLDKAHSHYEEQSVLPPFHQFKQSNSKSPFIKLTITIMEVTSFNKQWKIDGGMEKRKSNITSHSQAKKHYNHK